MIFHAFKLTVVALLVLLYSQVWSYSIPVPVSEVEVYDGDTIVVNIPKLPDIFGKRMRVRLAGIDTPELKTLCRSEKNKAEIARDTLKEAINKADNLYIIQAKRGKYFRLIASVYTDYGLNLSDYMLSKNMAVPYYGGPRKKEVCDEP